MSFEKVGAVWALGGRCDQNQPNDRYGCTDTSHRLPLMGILRLLVESSRVYS